MLTAAERSDLNAKLHVVFKPATPITNNDIFSGRQAQLGSIVSALTQNGRHAIVYGERAVGKTSLTNVLRFHLTCPGRLVLMPAFNCKSDDTFKTIWARAIFKIGEALEKAGCKMPRGSARYLKLTREGFDDFVTPEIIERVLSDVSEEAVLVITIDEFDTLEDAQARRAIADTIKSLSDRNSPASVILVGVADDVETLIHDHESVERCLTQVPMPRMDRDELEEIVRRCLKVVAMEIDKGALHEISRIAQGLPHYAHLLGLYAGITATSAGTKVVSQLHVEKAVPVALTDNSQATIQKAYQKATISSRKDATFKQLLAACAMSPKDDFGYFSPSDIVTPLGMLLGKGARIEVFAKHLHSFCGDEFGRVLKKTTIRNRPRFRFSNSMMAPYALMRGIGEGFVTEGSLKATRDEKGQARLF